MHLMERRMSPGVSMALRRVWAEWHVQRRHKAPVKKARRLARATPLRVNLGSGSHPKAAWINVDWIGEGADLQLDLREALPFHHESAAQIYAGHFFQHLSYPDLAESTAWELETPQSPSEALRLLRECRRVLIPGGRLDLVVPDAERILTAYAARQTQPRILERAGFVGVERREFDPDIDQRNATRSLFVRACKPAVGRETALA
jgi:hypothetical protein